MATSQIGGTERTIGQLVAEATQDLSAIVRSEIELAKAELSGDAKNIGVGVGLFGGAGVMGHTAFVLLMVAAALGLIAAGVWAWLAFLIVAVILLIVGTILGLVGRRKVEQIKGKPERAIAAAQETIAAVKPRS